MKRLIPIMFILMFGLTYSCSISTEQHKNCYYIERINVTLVDYLGIDTYNHDKFEPFNWDSGNDTVGISVEFIQVFYADKNAEFARRRSGSIEPGLAGSQERISQFKITAIDSTQKSIELDSTLTGSKVFASIDDFVHEFNTNGRRTRGTRLKYPVVFLISKAELRKFRELKTTIEIGKLKATTTILLEDNIRYSY